LIVELLIPVTARLYTTIPTQRLQRVDGHKARVVPSKKQNSQVLAREFFAFLF
jgi:hypothetical protein